MAESNFYSYLYGNDENNAFNESTESIDLTDAKSITRAFKSYVKDNTPPSELGEALLEEEFYLSPDEGSNGDEKWIRYDMEVPGVEEDFDVDTLKSYLEEFVEKIGAEIDKDATVEVDATPNERGGVNVDVFVAVKQSQK